MSQESWLFVNSFAAWLSAIGTIAAVVATVYFAWRTHKIGLKVSAGHRLLVGPGTPKPFPEILVIRVVNTGHRNVNITNIGWKVGLFRKRYAIQKIDSNILSSKLPVLLKEGEEVNYNIPIDKQNNWLEKFCKDMVYPYPKVNIHFVKIWASTSVDKTFESRIESNLKKKLMKFVL